MKQAYVYIYVVVCLLMAALVSGCSGSGSDSQATTSVNGVVMAGPVSGARVKVKAVLGTYSTTSAPADANGAYHIDLPNSVLAGDLIFQASGGTYTDEATGTTGVAFGGMSAHVAAGALSSVASVSIDPSSTIIQRLVAAGKTRAQADTLFNSTFGYTPDTTSRPVFAGMSSAATAGQRLAGVRAAAFSQLTKDLGIAADKQSDLLAAVAADLADGTLDGGYTVSGVTVPVDLAGKFNTALVTFQNSTQNKSKLTIAQLGDLPFAKTALTASYKVEYIPGTMAAAQGKTSFKIKLSNRADGTAATGKTIKLMPKMYMPTMSHSAPVDVVTESATPGTYDCSVYYLMASGPGMGIWELKVMIGMESALFYPPVAMAMGSTVRATLKGVNDTIGAMMGMGTSARTYYIFNEGVSGMGPYTFKLFLAAADDSMMMKFPAVSGGTTLHDAMNAAWTVDGATSALQVSSDSGTTWVSATDLGYGHWSAAGLSGLSSGGAVRVKVNINGEQKTTAGSATLSTTNLDYALFTITAGM